LAQHSFDARKSISLFTKIMNSNKFLQEQTHGGYMSSVMGITVSHLKQTLINNIWGIGHMALGLGVAAVANVAGHALFNVKQPLQVDLNKPNDLYKAQRSNYIRAAAAIAGVAASFSLVSRTHLIPIGGKEMAVLFALQALVVGVVNKKSGVNPRFYLLAFTGLCGFFGNRALLMYSAAGAILGAGFTIMNAKFSLYS
jgi:hypothetical protein